LDVAKMVVADAAAWAGTTPVSCAAIAAAPARAATAALRHVLTA
jgi:hypothetical protein